MRIVRFGVNNPVPINLLMVTLIVAGIAAGFSLRRVFFPESDPEQVLVTMPYPGASPEEIEQTLAIKVEDKLAELDEVKELTTTIVEGAANVSVELVEGIDAEQAEDEIERAIDSLQDLPDEAETIQSQLIEPRIPVIFVTIFGDVSERVLKEAIWDVRDDLRSLPGMGEMLVSGVRDYQVRVDVDQDAMLSYGLSLPRISDAIGQWLADVPGGTVRGSTMQFKIRTLGLRERALEIEQIVITMTPDGKAVRVADIAKVHDGFVDDRILNRHNGKPAANLNVLKVGDQDIVTMAEMVRAYVRGRNGEPLDLPLLDRLLSPSVVDAWNLGRNTTKPLPPEAMISANSDFARFVEGRLNLLLKNASYGAILVFIVLLLALNWRVALWVGVGLFTAMAGTLALMAALDITLNLLTMFGLIVVLGLLVDDAIVVSENIQTRFDQGERRDRAAIRGAKQVFWPVVATVLTSVVAFMPLTFLKGRIGDLLGALPFVVACALVMSLIESLLILPSHMAHSLPKDTPEPGGAKFGKAGSAATSATEKPASQTDDRAHAYHNKPSWLRKFEKERQEFLGDWLIPHFARWLDWLVTHRYITVAAVFAVWVITLGMVRGGYVEYRFLSRSDAETIMVDVRLPIGSTVEQTNQVVQVIEQAAQAQDETKSVGAVIGQSSNIESGVAEAASSNIAQMFIELVAVQDRDRSSNQVIDSMRKAIDGKVDQAERVNFSELAGGPGGADISVRISGHDYDARMQAVAWIKQQLKQFAGVYEISDDDELGQPEVQIQLRPWAAAQGFGVASVAQQVRGFLFGLDAHTFSERREDIDVRVRLDESTRADLHAIENAWLIDPAGRSVPLTQIADTPQDATYATIRRADRQRATTVTASTATELSPEAVVAQIPFEQLRQQYPQLHIELTGRQQQQSDAFSSLPWGFLAAVVMIYVILACLFGSFLQPLVVMSVFPFATIGVILGHWALGFDLTFLSMIGFVALSGIVVNDSLILIKFYNTMKSEQNLSTHDALVAAGKARLRAILLTTATTFFGLMPLLLEQSFQARFLIPMAIALAVGLLAATVLVLVFLPCLVMILEDVKRVFRYAWTGGGPATSSTNPSAPAAPITSPT